MQELNQYFLCFHGNVRTFERMSNSNILLELYSTLTVKCFWRFLSSKKCKFGKARFGRISGRKGVLPFSVCNTLEQNQVYIWDYFRLISPYPKSNVLSLDVPYREMEL